MKNHFITLICFVLIASFVLPIYAEDANPCDTYRYINMTVYIRGNYVYYDLSNNGTIEAPHVDSVWITRGEDQSTVKATSYAQSGEPVYDISTLDRGHYILWIKIEECVLGRLFIVRGVHSGNTNIFKENIFTSKILRNGQLLIIRDKKTYTVTGQEVN